MTVQRKISSRAGTQVGWSLLRCRISSRDRGSIFGGVKAELAVVVFPQAMLFLCPLAVVAPRVSFVAAGCRRHLLPGRSRLQARCACAGCR